MIELEEGEPAAVSSSMQSKSRESKKKLNESKYTREELKQWFKEDHYITEIVSTLTLTNKITVNGVKKRKTLKVVKKNKELTEE